MIKITSNIYLDASDIVFTFIRSSGPGGQNVNKVATAVLLRFNIFHARLPETLRTRLQALIGRKVTTSGDLLIKCDSYRTQERNKEEALKRLVVLLRRAALPPKIRRKTKPPKASIQKRLENKKIQGAKKAKRGLKRNALKE